MGGLHYLIYELVIPAERKRKAEGSEKALLWHPTIPQRDIAA